MRKTIYETANVAETQELAVDLASSVGGGEVLCLYGPLGSGKTSFMQGFAKKLGVSGKIISPTFTIMRSYQAQNNVLYHIDLYRLTHENETKELGLEDIMGEKAAIVAIEWPEKMGSLLPKKRIDIHFEYIDGNQRRISIERYE